MENYTLIAERNPKRFDTYLVKTIEGCYDFAHFENGEWHPGLISGGEPFKWMDIPQDHFDKIDLEKTGPKS